MTDAMIESSFTRDDPTLNASTPWVIRPVNITPETWFSYSETMCVYLDPLNLRTGSERTRMGQARCIARYYDCALAWLKKSAWRLDTFLALHNTVECWPHVPGAVWHALNAMEWSASPLYQWSLDNSTIQQKALNTRPVGKFHAEPLHFRMGAGLLTQLFNGAPLLVDHTLHGQLWTAFHGEEVYQTSQNLEERIRMLCQATPGAFEYAVTEFYQHAPQLFTLNSCAQMLHMNMAQGNSLNTCAAALLVYAHLGKKKRAIFHSLEARYPGLLQGFDIHLAFYPDVADALFHAPALLEHWKRTVHAQKEECVLALPEGQGN